MASEPRQDKPFADEGPVCRKCGYLLRGTSEEGNCPECGVTIRPSDPTLIPWVEHPKALRSLRHAGWALIACMLVALPIRLIEAGMVNGFLFGYVYGRGYWQFFNLLACIAFGYGTWQLCGWRERNWKWPESRFYIALWRFVFVFMTASIYMSSMRADSLRLGSLIELPFWLFIFGKLHWEFRRFLQLSNRSLANAHLLLCGLLVALISWEGFLYLSVDRTPWGEVMFERQWKTDLFCFILAWAVLGTLLFWIGVERLSRRIKQCS